MKRKIEVYYNRYSPLPGKSEKMRRFFQSIFLLLIVIGIPFLIIRQLDFGRKFPHGGIGREIHKNRRTL